MMIDGKTYIYWVNGMKYEGVILDEDDTHFIVNDIKRGKIKLPKASTIIEEVRRR